MSGFEAPAAAPAPSLRGRGCRAPPSSSPQAGKVVGWVNLCRPVCPALETSYEKFPGIIPRSGIGAIKLDTAGREDPSRLSFGRRLGHSQKSRRARCSHQAGGKTLIEHPLILRFLPGTPNACSSWWDTRQDDVRTAPRPRRAASASFIHRPNRKVPDTRSMAGRESHLKPGRCLARGLLNSALPAYPRSVFSTDLWCSIRSN